MHGTLPTATEVLEPFGPEYPKLPSLDKYRREARKGLSDLSKDERREYGNAVHKAILALQKSEARSTLRQAPESRLEPIGEARRNQLRARLLACPAQERRNRTPEQWQSMYEETMRQKTKSVPAAAKLPGRSPPAHKEPVRTPRSRTMTENATTRAAALALLSDGAANLSEVARLAGVDRQLVRYWAKAAGINWRKIRDARLARLWERETK